jgi:hypothetical protein
MVWSPCAMAWSSLRYILMIGLLFVPWFDAYLVWFAFCAMV